MNLKDFTKTGDNMDTKYSDLNSKQSKRQSKKEAALAHNAAIKVSEGSLEPSAEQRDELVRLSTKLFKTTSRWQTLLRKGLVESLTEEVIEYVPAELDGDNKVVKEEEMIKHQEPVKAFGSETSHILVKKVFTVESLIKELKDREEKYDIFVDLMMKQRKEAQDKKEADLLAEQVQNVAGGSTL